MSATALIPLPRAEARRRQTARYVWRVAVIVLALALWHVFSLSSLGRSGQVPSPIEAVSRLAELMTTATFWGAVGNTFVSFALGLGLSVIVGVPLGLVIGSNRRLEVSTRLVVDFLRTIPAIAFLPIALLVFGVDRDTVLFLIFLSAVWPILVQATYAAAQIDPVLKQVRRAFHLTWWQYIRFQFAPSALPFLTTGLRIAAIICLLTAISAEFLGGIPGIGQQLQNALVVSQTVTLYAYVLTCGILGILLNTALLLLQRKLIAWHPSIRGGGR